MTERPDQPGEHNEDTPRPEDASTIKDSREMLTGGQKNPMIGLTVGQYTIKRVIGSGGMGTVYEALQQSPRRTVALKMLKEGIASRSALKRFEYEAQTLGRLRHEHIAQIYEAGTWDDGTGARPYFAMEYLAGAKSLTQYARDKKLGTRERLELFLKVCDAVQHGHHKGIIHRDLKPENILVTSSGVPKIIDFGVARSTDSDMAITTLQTDVGALIGTMQYMSPEQCAADPNDIDTRSDVYALGVILFELLCEDLPYDVTQVALHEAARIVQEEEPTKPSTHDKRLRGDLEIITLKALEKDRDRRYQSAVELEQDVDRYLTGDPIIARGPGMIYQISKWIGRRRYGVGVIVVFITMAMGLIFSGSEMSGFGNSVANARKLTDTVAPTMVNFVSENADMSELLVQVVVSRLPNDLEMIAQNQDFQIFYTEMQENASYYGPREDRGVFFDEGSTLPLMWPVLNLPDLVGTPTPSSVWALMQDTYDPNTFVTDEEALRLAATLPSTSSDIKTDTFNTDPSWPRGLANLRYHLNKGLGPQLLPDTWVSLQKAGYINSNWIEEGLQLPIDMSGATRPARTRKNIPLQHVEDDSEALNMLLAEIAGNKKATVSVLSIVEMALITSSNSYQKLLNILEVASKWSLLFNVNAGFVLIYMVLFTLAIIMGMRLMLLPWQIGSVITALLLPGLTIAMGCWVSAWMYAMSTANEVGSKVIGGLIFSSFGLSLLILFAFTITFMITWTIVAYCNRSRFNMLVLRCIYYPSGMAIFAFVLILAYNAIRG